MGRSKYPSLGILDALFRLVYGFHMDPSKNGLYESLSSPPSRVWYSKILYQLHRSGYIKYSKDGVMFTSKGERKALLRHMEQIKAPKKRDGLYRLIAFDVPEKMRAARDAMRQKLYEFECTKIQKSLYLTPYVCEKEIGEIADILKLQNHVNVFVLKSQPSLRSLSRSWKRTEVKK